MIDNVFFAPYVRLREAVEMKIQVVKMSLLEVLLFVSTPLPPGLRASVDCTATAPLGHLWRVSRVNTGTIAVYS